MKKEYFISCFLVFLLGCNDIENCGADLAAEPKIWIGFNDLESQSEKTVGFEVFSSDPSVQFLLPEVQKIDDGDTTFVREAQFFGLPLNTQNDTTTYFFVSDTSRHELVITYNKEFLIFDPKCNPSLIFNNIDTASQTFDSTVIVSRVAQIFKNSTTNPLISTFEIYF